MIEYTIIFNNDSEKFTMEGKESYFLSDLLIEIAIENKVSLSEYSEAHQLQLILDSGVKVKLLEQDGSVMWA